MTAAAAAAAMGDEPTAAMTAAAKTVTAATRARLAAKLAAAMQAVQAAKAQAAMPAIALKAEITSAKTAKAERDKLDDDLLDGYAGIIIDQARVWLLRRRLCRRARPAIEEDQAAPAAAAMANSAGKKVSKPSRKAERVLARIAGALHAPLVRGGG